MIDAATTTPENFRSLEQLLSTQASLTNQATDTVSVNSVNSGSSITVAPPEIVDSIDFEFIAKVFDDSGQNTIKKETAEPVSESFESLFNLFPSLPEINITSLKGLQLDEVKPDTEAALPQPTDFKTIPVGILIGRRNVKASVLVRGEEDGAKAIEFDRWLIPYDVVINTLKFNVKTFASEQVELRSSGIITRINLAKLKKDPQLGLVFSVDDLQKYFGISADFDIKEYAIRLNVPWSEDSIRSTIEEKPVILEGLPRLQAPTIGISSISQQLTLTGGDNQPTQQRGDLSAIGTAFGGSWFLRANQLDLQNTQTWNLTEAQFLRQTDTADYVVGSQVPFWPDRGANGDYWGFSTIKRSGFQSPNSAGNTLPQQRMQAATVRRTISGRAAPGTLVRLVQNFTNRTVAEVLVDSDGIYEFDNVIVDGQISITNYRLYLYPQGKLTAQPEIREVTFNNVAGQLPLGASLLNVSFGWQREYNNGFVGQFTDFQGGVQGRWGVSENLTLGLGAVYDGSARGLGEIFWQPENFPLSVAISALTPGVMAAENKGWVFNSNINYQPSTNFQARFSSDYLRNRLNVDWQVMPGMTLFGIVDSNNPAALGTQFVRSRGDSFTFARVSVDTKARWRWNLLQRMGRLELLSDGSEIGSSSELGYYFSPSRYTNIGHALTLGYQNRFNSNSNSISNDLLSLNWRYRSQKQTQNGNPLWETQLGYGIGSNGSGIIASAQTSILPGLSLRARYQGVSLSSDDSSFSLEFLPSLNLQGGLWDNSDYTNSRLRTQGGLLLQAFFDKNSNGKRDSGEKIYENTLDLLVRLNNKPLATAQPKKAGARTWVHLSPGKYRLDFDPAGFPFDWQVSAPAYAVDVVAGSFTPIMVPLVPAYTLSGVITDKQGKAISGARVEAINLQSGQRYLSITNSAGVYYLEYLPQGNFELRIDGQLSQPQTVTFNSTSENMQKLNLQFTEIASQQTQL
ncbi:hypothetical protein CAL7716_030360 [Calothrix sp. PCC 7716]|nr:hypothetical protein CAL7716_030360 [Calothrix sp. PCC 7716]